MLVPVTVYVCAAKVPRVPAVVAPEGRAPEFRAVPPKLMVELKVAAPPMVFAPVVVEKVPELPEKLIAVDPVDVSPLMTGAVRVLVERVWLEETSTMFTPSMLTTPAETRASVVSEALPSSMEPTPRAVEVEATSPAIGRPVALVRVSEDGVPRAGVEKEMSLSPTEAQVLPVPAARVRMN